jgi:hypothetical protein
VRNVRRDFGDVWGMRLLFTCGLISKETFLHSGDTFEAKGVLNVELTIRSMTMPRKS